MNCFQKINGNWNQKKERRWNGVTQTFYHWGDTPQTQEWTTQWWISLYCNVKPSQTAFLWLISDPSSSYSPQGAILCWSEENITSTSLVGLRFLKSVHRMPIFRCKSVRFERNNPCVKRLCWASVNRALFIGTYHRGLVLSQTKRISGYQNVVSLLGSFNKAALTRRQRESR